MTKKVKHTLNLSVEIECPHTPEFHDKLKLKEDDVDCPAVIQFLESHLIGYNVEFENEIYEEVEVDTGTYLDESGDEWGIEDEGEMA